MKTSCSSWSHHRTFKAGTIDQMQWIQECADLEFDGVELLGFHFPSTDRDYLRTLKKACTDRYLTIPIVSAGGHLTTTDDAKREREVASIREWTEVASFLGAPRIRFFCGKGDELEAGGKALYDKVLASMREIAAIGRREGIVMALENHGGTTADQLLSLHRDVDSEYLKFTLDIGNFPPTSAVGPETYTSIERCAPMAAIVHFKFFEVNEDGSDRRFDLNRIHGILKKVGFNGFLSVEYEGDDPDEVPIVRRIARFMKTVR